MTEDRLPPKSRFCLPHGQQKGCKELQNRISRPLRSIKIIKMVEFKEEREDVADLDKPLEELVSQDNKLKRFGGYGSKGRRASGERNGDFKGHHREERSRGRRRSFDEESDPVETEYKRKMEGRRLFVSNLSFETEWKYLKDHMRQAGNVVRADIFEDDRGRSRGIGYVL